LRGDAGDRYAILAETLADALALVEAGIDFTDQEDVVAIAPNELSERIASVLEGAREALAGAGAVRAGGAAATVVLAGAPSAGKSTLFNALLGRERAVVAAEPGTTRDVLRETLELDGESPGLEVKLVDIAGLDAAFEGGSVVDARARRAAVGAIESAEIVVQCDPTGAFAPIEGVPDGLTLRVRTKADLPIAYKAGDDELGVCALDGWNIGPLRRAIADAARRVSHTQSGDDLTVLPRHEAALYRAVHALSQASERAKHALDRTQIDEPEIIAGLLRDALNALGEICGRIEPDDVIGRVFAHFCVGK
jgi:tRNA modification GTPase